MALRQPSPSLTLAAIVLVGAILRFWHLDDKPLWADEILSALFSLGRSSADLPLNEVFSHFQLSLNSDATCGEIARTVAVESTHPPLFFCLTHGWISVIDRVSSSLAWQMRSLSALLGTGAIVAVYILNSIAFSRTAGLVAASLMAVSPFCVYLSQEARHYTLPLLLVTIALAALIQILQSRKHRLLCIAIWIAANTIGLYVHYFFIIAYAAQIAIVLSLVILRSEFVRVVECEADNRQSVPPLIRRARGDLNLLIGRVRGNLSPFLPVFFIPLFAFLPWMSILLNHFNRPETDWFVPFQPHWTDVFSPILQTIAALISMVVVPPVEGESLWVVIPLASVAIAFFLWFAYQVWKGYKQLWQQPGSRLSTFILTSFTTWILLAYFIIVYLLGKDITVAPRYHFLYYPSLCTLVASSLSPSIDQRTNCSSLSPLFIGLISSILIVNNGAFHKPYYPDRFADRINLYPDRPAIVVTGYQDLQEVALGLSFVIEVEKLNRNAPTQFAFWSRSPQYDEIWQQLARVSPFPVPFDLWVVGPGLRQIAYPDRLFIGTRSCQRDPQNYYRIGIPYQRYHCQGGQGFQKPSTIRLGITHIDTTL